MGLGLMSNDARIVREKRRGGTSLEELASEQPTIGKFSDKWVDFN